MLAFSSKWNKMRTSWVESRPVNGLSGVFSRDELAERLGWDAAGSHLRNRLSELAAMAIVYYPARGQVALQGWVR
jgi:hypothetical protein